MKIVLHFISITSIGVLFIVISSLFVLKPTDAVSCYTCNDCPEPFYVDRLYLTSLKVAQSCTFCARKQSFSAGRRWLNTRGCQRECTNVYDYGMGYGTIVTCCNNRNFCNSTQRNLPNIAATVLIGWLFYWLLVSLL